MESLVEYYRENNEVRVKYTNLYYIDNVFNFLTTNKDIQLEKVRTLNTEELLPTIMRFENRDKLLEYINTIKYSNVGGITGYISHFYDWNIAHGLYDSLYPIYLTYLKFFSNDTTEYNNDINIFINLRFIPGWSFPGIASREWTLDIFKQFSGGLFIKENEHNVYIKENFRFETFIAGTALAGITAVNKNGEMPGREIYALEKFRNRMFQKYTIPTEKVVNNERHERQRLVIRIINSRRYSSEEKTILMQIINELKNKGHDAEYIYWEKINSFKAQLEIMSKIDIHIAGCGTSMLNFPFLNDKCVHINLGANPIVGCDIPGLMEVNISLLSNNIYCDYYDIIKYKKILYERLIHQIYDHINIIIKQLKFTRIVPEYIKLWQKYCIDNDVDILIKRMNGIIKPHLMTYRWPECVIFNSKTKNT